MQAADELEEEVGIDEVLAGASEDEPTGEEAAPPAGATEAEPEASEEAKPHTVPLGALKEERAKRQELESRLRQLENAQTQARQQAQAPSKQELENRFLSDPVEFLKELETSRQQQLVDATIQNRITLSEEWARDKYEDYEEVVQVFKDAALQDPTLGHQLRSVSNPAKFAYEKGKELAPKPEGDFDARVKEAALELLREQGLLTSTSTAIPKTTAGARNASFGQEPVVEDSVEALFGRDPGYPR